jgi:chromosome segregation ATPase
MVSEALAYCGRLIQQANERYVLEDRIASLLASLENIETRCSDAERLNSSMRNEKQKLELQQGMRIKNLEDTLKDRTFEIEQLQILHGSLSEEAKKTSEQKVKLEAEASSLRNSLNVIAHERDKLKTEHATLSSELHRYKELSQELLSAKDAELKALRNHSDELERTKGDQIKILKKRVESLERTLLQTGESWKKTQEDIVRTTNALAAKEEELNTTILVLQKSEVKVSDLERQLKASMTQQQQMQAEAVVNADKVSMLESHQRALEEAMSNLQNGSADTQQNHLRVVDELHKLSYDIRRRQEDIEKLQQKVVDQASQLTAFELQTRDLQRDLNQSRSHNEEYEMSVKRLKQQLQAAQDQEAEDTAKYMQKIQNLNAECLQLQVPHCACLFTNGGLIYSFK